MACTERTKAWRGDARGHGIVQIKRTTAERTEMHHNHQDSMTAAEKATETKIVRCDRTEH